MEIRALGMWPAAMKKLDRDLHDGLVLDDLRDLDFHTRSQRNFQASTIPEACLLTTPEVENLTLGDPCVTRIGGCDSFDATTFTQQVFAESGEMPLTPLGEPKILTALKRIFFVSEIYIVFSFQNRIHSAKQCSLFSIWINYL